MAKGRKAISKTIKRAQGTLDSRYVNDNAPDLPIEIPMLPDDYPLNEGQRACYDELATLYYAHQIITATDREYLAEGARLLYDVRQMWQAVEDVDGLTYDHIDREGNKVIKVKARELRTDYASARREWVKWLSESGLTPASREKVSKITEKKGNGKRIQLD